MKVHVITCTHCGKAVTPAFSWPEENGPFVLRAFVECPECVEAQPDLPQAELELARRVADAAMAVEIATSAIDRISRLDAAELALSGLSFKLFDAEHAAIQARAEAVREYRARVEAAAFMAQPAVRRGLEGVGEMEED